LFRKRRKTHDLAQPSVDPSPGHPACPVRRRPHPRRLRNE
jgi:hypothetical protein